jgi:predicted nucleic acid-binding protein
MKQRFYIDTSVWGGLFDEEFERETALLFEMVKSGQAVCLYSDTIEKELAGAPERIRTFFESFPEAMKERVDITPEIVTLATAYVEENVVGATSFDDCVHIATATVYRADLLVSWNFKHIVNVYRARGYNAINMRRGYPVLSIHSPKEIVSYGND